MFTSFGTKLQRQQNLVKNYLLLLRSLLQSCSIATFIRYGIRCRAIQENQKIAIFVNKQKDYKSNQEELDMNGRKSQLFVRECWSHLIQNEKM